MSNSSDYIYEKLFINSAENSNISVFIAGAENSGATWCALSIAHALNLMQKKVLLIDSNGNFSNICTYLSLNNQFFLEDYFLGKKTLNQLLIAYKNKDFNLLTSKSGSNFLYDQPNGRIQIFADDVKILAENYEQTIIDLGSNDIEKKLNICKLANNNIIVCSENNTDLARTFDTIKLLNESQIDTNYYLIINKVASFEDGYKIYEKLTKALERNNLKSPELLGIIRFDTRVRDTIKNKELLMSRYSESEAAIDIANISKKLDWELI